MALPCGASGEPSDVGDEEARGRDGDGFLTVPFAPAALWARPDLTSTGPGGPIAACGGPAHTLGGVMAARPSAPGGFHALAVDDAGRRR